MALIPTLAETAAAALFLLLQATPGTGRVIECHDPARDIVQSMRPHDCRGEIVDAAKAAEIRERLRLERARALRSGGGQVAPTPPARAVVIRYGTAFPVTADGHFLTAAHVVVDCPTIRLVTGEGEGQPATLLDIDEIRDIALLQSGLQVPRFTATAQTTGPGLPVTAIGYPEEGRARIRPRIDEGAIRQVGRGPGNGLYIAAEIGLRHGNSGGPLLDDRGNLLGLVISKLDRTAFYAATGRESEDLVLAVANPSLIEFLARNDLHLDAARGQDAGDGESDNSATSAARRVVRVVCGPASP